LEQIQWLQDNDDLAKQIGQNGKKVYNRLYNLPNFIEDTTSVFQKYASLQTYEAVAPEERHAWTERKYCEKNEKSEDPDIHVSIEEFFYDVEEKDEQDDDDFDEDEDEEADEDDEKDELWI